MMRLSTTLTLLFCMGLTYSFGQINAKLTRYMDVSETQITFVYGGDIWVMPKTGGMAVQITHSPGEESWPKFSPDGKSIAFTASYNGNQDIYVMPSNGGLPTRVTYQSHPDRMVAWHPDGEQILFASARGPDRLRSQLFMVSKDGGFATALNIPYGELASFSPDGEQLAYITKITEDYPFKRYRGGLTSDILIYDFQTNVVERITTDKANDGKPTWAGDKVYFLSDRDKNLRLNIWEYNPQSKEMKQVTKFKDFDISFLSAGPKELIFEAGGELYLMDLNTQKYKTVDVNVVSDLSVEMPRSVNVGNRISSATASPEGKRVIFEARGELFNAPVKEGFVMNMTKSSGAFDRHPSYSPDGKHIAFWSDQSGEFEIYTQISDGSEPAKKLTNRNKGFGYALNWSPNGEQIAFIDETNTISIVEVATGNTIQADNTVWNQGHGGRFGYPINWSPDSKWITYIKGTENANNAIFIYNLEEKKASQVTSAYYNDRFPVFSTDGKYLFYLTDRALSPHYSDFDDTWIYPNSTKIASISLTKDVPSLLHPKNDDFVKKEGEKKPKKDTAGIQVEIDFENIEARLTLLPPPAGNYRALMPFEGKLVYWQAPNTGDRNGSSALKMFDFNKRESAEIMGGVSGASLTADKKAILVRSRGRYGIIRPAPKQKIAKPIPTDGLVMDLIPKQEWEQIFNDTWRRHRDFFYDPNMHGLDWDALKDRYGALLKDARTRWDVINIQTNLVAELSAGHTYIRGGETERVRPKVTGFLGIDWQLNNGKYFVKRVIRPAAWDTDVRSPFDRPGVNVKEGDCIHSVNGVALDPNKDPYAAFEGMAGETVMLMVSSTGEEDDAEQVIVECMSRGEERYLRHLAWMERNRKMVEDLSDGQLGYVYMSNTSGRGQMELVKMYYGQLDKKGFIIDERFNGGGQLADRFMELLLRPVVYNLHWRHGKDHTQPIKANTGPMGMLINGWAGSGGDGLPWAFQELKAGPIVGERTLGILVGPATGHQLIDGGGITVPGARLYDNDGHWFWEGEGVAPDIEVWDDPNLLMQGRDPQIERVVEEVMKNLKNNPTKMTPAPAREDRTAKGLSGKK